MELVRLIKTTKKPPPSRSIHGKKTERSLSQTIIRHNIEKRISHLLEDLYKKGKLRVVTLQKSPVYGYGIKLLTIDGIYTKVGSITPNSPADLSKQIFEGDILIANNGKNLVDIGASNVVASLSEKNSATLLLIPEDEHIFSFRARRRFKKQLNELQTHFGQLKQKRDEEFERQRQIVEKRRLEEEKRRVEEERQKKEREWRIWFMNLKVEDLKQWVKTLTDKQIVNLPYKKTYMLRSGSSLNDDWNYAQSYEAFDDELKKIKKQAQKRVDQKERERYYEELKSQGINPFQ